MRTDVRRGGGFFAAALVCVLAVAPAVAPAQEAPDTSAISVARPSNADDDGNSAEAESPLSPEDSALIGNALVFDPPNLAAPAKSLRLRGLPDRESFDVSGTANADGTGTVVLKRPLPNDWGAKVGADLDIGNSKVDRYGAYMPLTASREDSSSAAAWASLGMTDFATVDTRVDPRSDQSRLGTTFSHSIPVGSRFSVTLQNTYSITETYGQPQTAPSDLPMMAEPPSDPAASRVFGKEGVAKFKILPTGTTLGAGLSTTNVDPVTHNTLSAEQKIYGPLNVTTALTDVGQPTASKSVTAGFKLTW